MKRSILMSLFVIGAMASLVAVGTWAQFTDSGTGSGTVTAGTVDIVLDGDVDDNIDLTFNSDAGCPSPMAPGDTCTDTVGITNDASTLAIDYTATAEVTAGKECDDDNVGDDFTVSVGHFVDTTVNPGTNDTNHFPAGLADSETFHVHVTLDAAVDDDCQGDSATVTLTVSATQDTVDPQDPNDDHAGP